MPVNVAGQDEQCVVSEFEMGKEGENGDIGVFVRLVREESVLVKLVLEVGEVGEIDGVAFGRMTASTLALDQWFVEDEMPWERSSSCDTAKTS